MKVINVYLIFDFNKESSEFNNVNRAT